MTKKTSAAWMRFVAGALLLGACAAAWGQGEADFKALARARANELAGLPFDEVQKAVLRSEIAMQKLNEEAQAARLAVRELQEKMRIENPEVQAKYKEIEEMRAKINAFIDELPEVKAQIDAAKAADAKLMEEIWYRTAAMGIAANLDRAEGHPERAEPVLDETDAVADSEQKKDLEP